MLVAMCLHASKQETSTLESVEITVLGAAGPLASDLYHSRKVDGVEYSG